MAASLSTVGKSAAFYEDILLGGCKNIFFRSIHKGRGEERIGV